MFRFLSYLLVFCGIVIITYAGLQIYNSNAKTDERLKEAMEFVSDDIVTKEDEVDKGDFEAIEGDTVGSLYIPKLDREIPVVEGTDEKELAQGVGHYAGTGFPGDNKQILLSGHRDTVFRDFGELDDGDEFHVKMAYGTFVYVIKAAETQIVDADDTTVIDPSREDEVLTVSTCYPFSFIGSAPDRYVLHAYPK